MEGIIGKARVRVSQGFYSAENIQVKMDQLMRNPPAFLTVNGS